MHCDEFSMHLHYKSFMSEKVMFIFCTMKIIIKQHLLPKMHLNIFPVGICNVKKSDFISNIAKKSFKKYI